MSFDWNQYIILANKLIENNPQEAEIRSAISRAYYGAFIPCRNYKGYGKTTKDIHQKVIDDFKKSDIQEGVSLGNFLDSLRSKRNNADYDGFCKYILNDVKNHISIANSILTLLKKIQEKEN